MREAQRLADALEIIDGDQYEATTEAAAAELRRLDAVNTQLLEFAREYLSNWGDLNGYLQDMARAAIAAQKGKP